MSKYISIPREEYNDLCLMRRYIYDNGLVFQYEMFLDVLKQLQENPIEIESIETDYTDITDLD